MYTGRPKLAVLVALAYILVIVFASLQPFQGWRMPPAEVFGFLRAPWPRYITASDIALNIAAYLPLGAMLFVALKSPLSDAAALVIATLIAATLSLGLESVQMFLPTRIASNVDLISNSAGACFGALAAWLASLPAFAGNSFKTTRHRMFRAGTLGDCGLLLVVLWIIIQFHPAPLTFGSGDLRDALQLEPFFGYAPQSYLLTEAAIVALATIAVGLLISLLLLPGQNPLLAALTVLLLALAARAGAAATLARSAHWLQWFTPGIALGLAAGVIGLALLVHLTRAGRITVAAACIIACVIVVNIAPGNPYQASLPFMLIPQQTHLINFSQIMRVLSGLWPLLAIAYLVVLEKAADAAGADPAA
jgi:VanZ family protein